MLEFSILVNIPLNVSGLAWISDITAILMMGFSRSQSEYRV
jgi:hypothetical protein